MEKPTKLIDGKTTILPRQQVKTINYNYKKSFAKVNME